MFDQNAAINMSFVGDAVTLFSFSSASFNQNNININSVPVQNDKWIKGLDRFDLEKICKNWIIWEFFLDGGGVVPYSQMYMLEY